MNEQKYNGFYQELFDITNDEVLVVKLHSLFWGDTIKLPKYLHSSDYVAKLVLNESDIIKKREIPKKYGYTYDTIAKKIRNKPNNL